MATIDDTFDLEQFGHETNGVRYTAPPDHLVSEVVGRIEQAVKDIGPKDLVLVGLVNKDGANAALVGSGPWGIQVRAWIGKTWNSDTDYGVEVLRRFTFD
jgi:hypothetical protein